MRYGVILLLIALLVAGWSPPSTEAQFDCVPLVAAWHPTEDYFALSCDEVVYLYTTRLEQIGTLVGPSEPPDTFPIVSELVWSPDGLYLAGQISRYETPAGGAIWTHIVVWDVASGAVILDIPERKRPLAWSPDSHYIAVIGLYSASAAYFYDVTTGAEVGHCPECSGVSQMAWNPVDINQVVASYSGLSLVMDPLATPILPEFVEGINLVEDSYNVDGFQMVFHNYDQGQLEVRDAYTRQIVSTLPFGTIPGNPATYHWLDEGIYIQVSNGNSVRWDGVSQELDILPIDEIVIAWKPDGTLYIARDTESLTVQETETGNVLGRLVWDATSQVSSFSVLDAATSQPLKDYTPLADGAVFERQQLTTDTITFEATTNPSVVGSVVFELIGQPTHIDNTAPYQLPDWTLQPGDYVLTATPYGNADGTGEAGTAFTIRFSVVSDVPSTANVSPD